MAGSRNFEAKQINHGQSEIWLAADDKELTPVHTLCEDAGGVATTSLIESRIDQGQRRIWFLFESSRRR